MSEKHDAESTGRYLADVRADLQRMRSSPPPPAPTTTITPTPAPSPLSNAQSLAEAVFAQLGHDPVAVREFSAAFARLVDLVRTR